VSVFHCLIFSVCLCVCFLMLLRKCLLISFNPFTLTSVCFFLSPKLPFFPSLFTSPFLRFCFRL
jgi:hypothetical protein